eukprot:gene40914-49904_t
MALDAYDVGLRIGQGGFSTVYRARQRETSREVAIKVIEKNINSSQELPNGSISSKVQSLRQRIDNEVVLHRHLKHSHIVQLLDCFEDDDYVYMVQEYCPDGNLYRLLKSWGRLSEAVSLEIIRQVLCAVQYIHVQGVIHRDLKLSNILIYHLDKSINLNTADTISPEQIVIKVCDFGFAVSHAHPDDEHHTLCGTPNYIAPEILQQPYASNAQSGHEPTLPLTLQRIRCTPYAPPAEGVSEACAQLLC